MSGCRSRTRGSSKLETRLTVLLMTHGECGFTGAGIDVAGENQVAVELLEELAGLRVSELAESVHFAVVFAPADLASAQAALSVLRTNLLTGSIAVGLVTSLGLDVALK